MPRAKPGRESFGPEGGLGDVDVEERRLRALLKETPGDAKALNNLGHLLQTARGLPDQAEVPAALSRSVWRPASASAALQLRLCRFTALTRRAASHSLPLCLYRCCSATLPPLAASQSLPLCYSDSAILAGVLPGSCGEQA